MAEKREVSEHNGSFNDFLSVVFRRKWIVVAPIIAAAAVIVWLIITHVPIYFSYSKLLINRGEQQSAYDQRIMLLSWEEELTSEMEIIRSDKIYSRAHELLKESPDYAHIGSGYRINGRMVSTNTPGKSHIIHISYEDPDSIAVREVVSALTRSYCEFRSEIRSIDPQYYLQTEIDNIEEEIVEREQRRADFLESEGAVDLVQERNHLLQEKGALSTGLEQSRADWAIQNAQLTWMRNIIESAQENDNLSGIIPFQSSQLYRDTSSLLQIRDLIIQTRSQLISARGQYTDKHPKIIALEDRGEELKVELIEAATGYLTQLEAMTDVTRAKLNSIQGSLDYLNERLRGFPSREAEVSCMDREIENLKRTHNAYINRRVEAMTTKVGKSPWDVTLLEDASMPVMRRTKDYIRFLLLLVVSSLIGLGLAFAFDNLDHTLKGRSEAEAALRVPVLASVSKHDK